MIRPTKTGFTLVELLVVIAIVSVLMAMLLPSLQQAREVSMSIKCMSGVRQVGMTHSYYMNDWNQTFVATGYVSQGDGWYPRLVNNGYAQQTQFTRQGGCPYAPARYQLGDNNDVFYGHGTPSKHSSYGMNMAMAGFIDYITKSWSVNDWNGASYTAKGITQARPHKYKRYQKWPGDVMMFHCSTVPNSTNYGLYGLNFRYTMGVATGTWVVEPSLSTYERHQGESAPMSFYDLHAERITPTFWITDRTREIRWKSMANYNKPEYLNAGTYLSPDM